MLLIGLTGNAGSGKTTALQIFKELGFCVVNADELVGELLNEEFVKTFIRDRFGEEYVYDRKKLSKFLFSNESAMRTYEMFIRKHVIDRVMSAIKECKEDRVIVEGALIFEYGLEDMFDYIITITADEGKLIERLKDKGYDEEHARNILKFQMPQEEKVRRSHFVIENNGSLDEFLEKVREISERLLKLEHDN